MGWNTSIADRHVVSSFYNCTCCCTNFVCISLCLFCWNISNCTCNNEFRLKRLILILQCKPSGYMFKSFTKLSTSNAHIIVRYLIAHSLELVHVHLCMFVAYSYGPVIYTCILPTVFCHSTWISWILQNTNYAVIKWTKHRLRLKCETYLLYWW